MASAVSITNLRYYALYELAYISVYNRLTPLEYCGLSSCDPPEKMENGYKWPPKVKKRAYATNSKPECANRCVPDRDAAAEGKYIHEGSLHDSDDIHERFQFVHVQIPSTICSESTGDR